VVADAGRFSECGGWNDARVPPGLTREAPNQRPDPVPTRRGKGRDSALCVGEVCAETCVVGFELENDRDACEVESVGEELADAAEPVEVVGAVAAGACRGSVGFEQALAFVESQVLGAGSDEFRRDRDAVHAAAGVVMLVWIHALDPRVSPVRGLASVCQLWYKKSMVAAAGLPGQFWSLSAKEDGNVDAY